MKRAFLTGLALLLPLILTLIIFVFLIDLFTTPFLNLAKNLLSSNQEAGKIFSSHFLTFLIRFVILIGLVIFTIFLGFIARWFFFNSLIKLSDYILSKTPFIRTVFKVSKDIVTALFGSQGDAKEAFKHPALVPFPSPHSDAVGFVTGSVPKACSEHIPNLVPVFIPTAPHPISGFLVLAPKEVTLPLKMTNEEAVKLIVSCGMITPPENNES